MRQRGMERNRLAGVGVKKPEIRGVEGLSRKLPSPTAQCRVLDRPQMFSPAVDRVTQDRVTDGREMDPDLMGPPRFREDLEECKVSPGLEDPPPGDGLSGTSRVYGNQQAILGVPSQGGRDDTCRVHKVTADHGHVAFLHSATLELPDQ